MLLKKDATCRVDPRPRARPAGCAQRGSSARSQWGRARAARDRRPRADIGSCRAGLLQELDAGCSLTAEGRAGLDPGAGRFALSSPASGYPGVRLLSLEGWHIPRSTRRPKAEGQDGSTRPTRAKPLPCPLWYTERPDLAGPIPRLLCARPSCFAESGRRREVDQPLKEPRTRLHRALIPFEYLWRPSARG